MISITSAFLALAFACMASAETAAQPSGQFSMTPSDLPEFLYMHPIPVARVKLYYTPHSPMRSKVLFGISAPRGGWIGIGWSPDCKMNGSDAVIGGIGSETAPPATYNLTLTATPDPSLQSVINSFGMRTSADQLSIILTVDRDVSGGRVALTAPSVCLIWAYSDSHDPGYHGEQRRGGVPISIPSIGGGSRDSGQGVASVAPVLPASSTPPSLLSSSSPSSFSPSSSVEAPGSAALGSAGAMASGPAGTGMTLQSASVPYSTGTGHEAPAEPSGGKAKRRIGHGEAVARVVLAMVVVVATLRSCLFE